MTGLSPEVAGVRGALEELCQQLGMEVHEVSMPSLRFAIPAYYILATSEASTNLARYCGMRFGVPEEEYRPAFQRLLLRRPLGGLRAGGQAPHPPGNVLPHGRLPEQYYLKALRSAS